MKNPDVYQLFVYGSLRSGFRSTAYDTISRYFELVGEAMVKGELFDLEVILLQNQQIKINLSLVEL
jgi:gamma-glutamylcyclotransferase (GGCT)/AIG2-like uncharacterized protein YtfP